jgi:catechol 2,3-dioxygenase-like lactoylglutathione lyase family enzyme
MPKASHHVSCITDDPQGVRDFLTGVVGLELHMQFDISGEDISRSADWPENEGTQIVLYGRPPAGIVEVIAIPESLRGRVAPRIWLVCFATAEIDTIVERTRRAGWQPSALDHTDNANGLTTSIVEVGGIAWEFVAFGARR